MPLNTPPSLKFLLFATAAASLSVAFLDAIFENFFPTLSLTHWLILSEWGWKNSYLWQFITYILIYPSYGIFSINYLISLALLLYVLWIMGAEVGEQVGAKKFLKIYFIIGVVAGLLAMAIWPGRGTFGGPLAPFMATFMLWTMLRPRDELLFIFFIRVERRWLFSAVVLGLFLVFIAQGAWLALTLQLYGIAGGYLYGVVARRLSSPFPFSKRLDQFLISLGMRWTNSKEAKTSATVLDFHTGAPMMNDDEFVDAMLARIARHGMESLSWSERKRLDAIARSKKKE